MLQRRVFEITIFVIYWLIAAEIIMKTHEKHEIDEFNDRHGKQYASFSYFDFIQDYAIRVAVALVVYLCIARSFGCIYYRIKNQEIKMYTNIWRQKKVLEKLEKGDLHIENIDEVDKGEVGTAKYSEEVKVKGKVKNKEAKDIKELRKQQEKAAKELKKQKEELKRQLLKEQNKVAKEAEKVLLQQAQQQTVTTRVQQQPDIVIPCTFQTQLLAKSSDQNLNIAQPSSHEQQKKAIKIEWPEIQPKTLIGGSLSTGIQQKFQYKKEQLQTRRVAPAIPQWPPQRLVVSQPQSPVSQRRKQEKGPTHIITPDIHSSCTHLISEMGKCTDSGDDIFGELKSILAKRAQPL